MPDTAQTEHTVQLDEEFPTGTRPCGYKDGVLRFRIRGEHPSMHYLTQEQ